MKILDRVIEKAFGIIFLVLGLAGFHELVPSIKLDRFIPELHPFLQILLDSGYFYIVKAIEALAGLMIVINYRIPLALALVTPVVVNIVLYHIFLDQRNWFVAPLVATMNMYLLWKYRDNFIPVLGKS